MNRLAVSAFCGLSLPLSALATMALDGDLNEPEWQQSLALTRFVVTQPFSLQQSDLATEARVLSTPDGLRIGFINQQNGDDQVAARHARDAEQSEADSVTVVIDTDGSGRAAYFFTVSLGNSVKDGTITNETNFSRDWNGDWQAATKATAQGWTAEVFVPWSAIPLPDVTGDSRTIRIGLTRTVPKRGQILSYPAAHWTRATYLSELAPLTISNQQSRGRFDFFPYVTTSYNRVTHDHDTRTGFDLVWKPTGSDQVTATINPDFGQVESDNLVVNFSAQETFFSEQRPFFTENHSLFDLTGNASLRMVHTRRIGAAPDKGNEGISDIVAAGKFLHVGEQFDAGAFWAQEDDSREAEGREYAVVRGLYKNGDASFGYLGTHVDRPTAHRDATVHTVDGQSKVGNWQWRGLLAASDVEWRDQLTLEQQQKNGFGTDHTWRHRESDRVTNDFRLMYFDREFDIRDLGFIERVDLKRARFARVMTFTDVDADSLSQGRDVVVAARVNRNSDNRRLYDDVSFEWTERFRDASRLYWFLFWRTDGIDDLTTRGHGVFKRDSAFESFIAWNWNEKGQFRNHAEIEVENQGIDHYTTMYHLHPGWVFNEQFSTSLGLFYTVSDEWLLWRDDGVSNDAHLATFDRAEWSMRWDINANLNERHEVRLGWQWLALKAKGLYRYELVNEQLQRGTAEADDFVVSQLAIQLRYTWRLGPLSNFYAVYSRGGYTDPDEQHNADASFNSIFEQSLNNPNAENFLLKLRLQF